MSTPLLLIVAGIYMAVAIDQLWRDSPAGFIVWTAYAVANLGLIWMTR